MYTLHLIVCMCAGVSIQNPTEKNWEEFRDPCVECFTYNGRTFCDRVGCLLGGPCVEFAPPGPGECCPRCVKDQRI